MKVTEIRNPVRKKLSGIKYVLLLTEGGKRGNNGVNKQNDRQTTTAPKQQRIRKHAPFAMSAPSYYKKATGKISESKPWGIG